MDLCDYYDKHWTDLPEGEVDFDRLRMIVDAVAPGTRVLESGCGPGFLAKLLRDKGADVVGTDVSRVGAERTAGRGIPTHHVDLDLQTLPFADQHFDTVVCNSNLEHLFFLDDNVAECARVLRVGGTFVWMEPNSAHWRYRLWLLAGRWPYIPESPTDPYHIRHLTAHELRRHCTRNGLVVTEVRGHAGLWCRGLYPRWFYARGIARVVRRIYPTLVRLRPQLFARYLFVRAVKRTHVVPVRGERPTPRRAESVDARAAVARGRRRQTVITAPDASESPAVPARARRWQKTARARLNMPVKYGAWAAGLKKGPFFPDRIYIESTNHCNLKCIMCPTGLGVMRRPKGYMDIALYERIIDEVAPSVGSAVLHSWGEPLMHPQLFEMIRRGKRAGIRMETSTNITLLNEERAREVLDAGLDVLYLAMDGVTKDTYERVRVNARWEKSVRNVERFLELKRQQGARTRVVMQIIAMDATRAEIDEFVSRWSRPEVDVVNVKHLDTWGAQEARIVARKDEVDAAPATRVPCPNLWYHAYVFWDGMLTSCERDYDVHTPLGNVGDAGVMAAWHGPAMQALRQRHVQSDFTAPACQRCIEWSWWTPSPWHSRGTAPKVDSHENERP